MVAPPRTEGDRWIGPMAVECRLRWQIQGGLQALLPRRQRDAETRAAARPVLHRDNPAEAQGQMPRDGKSKPGAAAIAVARGLKTQERRENPLAIRCGHARPAI